MAYYPYYSFYNFEEVIRQWEQIGVFDIILPLLLIFTVVYAVLDRTHMFGKDKRTVNAIIALVLSVLTIQNVAVTSFFKILFSQVAFGLAVMIAIIILTALVLGSRDTHMWRMVITVLGFIVFVWVFSRAADEYQRYYGIYAFGMFTSDWWAMNAPWIILVGIIAVIVIAVIASSRPAGTGQKFKDLARDFIGELD